MVASLEWVQRFRSVYGATDDRVLDMIVGTSGREVATALVTRHRQPLRAHTDGLIELVERWSEHPPEFDTAWDPAFGLADVVLTTGRGAVDAAVRIALRLTECGFPGSWQASLTVPSTMRLGDLLLSGVDQLTITTHRSGIRVRAAGRSGLVECLREAGAQPRSAQPWTSPAAGHIPWIGATRPIYLLGSDAAPLLDSGEAQTEFAHPVEKVDGYILERFQDSLDVITGCGYRGWVEDILRSVVVTAKDPGTHLMSGSVSSLPGMIHMSFPAGVMDMADALVHECAHQYFHLLRQVGPFVDGTDHSLYWSPPKRQHRPLDRILVAYHALANVLLFYRAVDEAGIDNSGYTQRNMPAIAAAIGELDQPLRSNPTLTDLGRMLYEPLAREIAAAG